MQNKLSIFTNIKLLFFTLVVSCCFIANASAGIAYPTGGGFWNTNLRMINILELGNPSTTQQKYTVAAYDNAGNKFIEKSYTLAAKTQRDIILNDTLLQGRDNQIGAIVINATDYDNLYANISYYRWNTSGTAVEFSYSIPANAYSLIREGTSLVTFNSTQPSFNPAEENAPIDQWLSIVNLSEVGGRFTIKTYNQAGEQIASKSVYVKAHQRKDIPAGDTRPNVADDQRSLIGLHEIAPVNEDIYYASQLVRYGHKAGAADEYSFAIPVISTLQDFPVAFVTISRGKNADNFVELANTSSADTEFQTMILGYDGKTKFNKSIPLKAHQQIHINAGSYLAEGQSGMLISGMARGGDSQQQRSASISGTSVSYFRDTNGSIKTAYSSPSVFPDSNVIESSYNLYLDSENWLRLYNPTVDKKTIKISFRDKNGALTEKQFSIQAMKGLELPLHDFARFNTSPDSTGAVFIEGVVLGEMVRVGGATIPGNIEFMSASPIGYLGFAR